jgi:hypothetical protein
MAVRHGSADAYRALRDLWHELLGKSKSQPSASARAVLGCALEALRFYLDGLPHPPTPADMRWFIDRVDDIFTECRRRNS